ncbi:hypothetical protein [Novipirellula artificiosorum]|uniref:Uncharacterized protein n=1 Tax=Novipirellula artificiosorum TaxID=2528016 RepID=A0A5C6DHA1_9BACT|nr:hypothetical protein [Novipirellula artificiosorum]TWU36028.1 hypothetical protein Poly41_37810 [Novipirellula artificiosorum]
MDDEKRHWPITQADRLQTVVALGIIIQSDDWPLALRATRLLLQMEQQNTLFDDHAEKRIKAELAELLG